MSWILGEPPEEMKDGRQLLIKQEGRLRYQLVTYDAKSKRGVMRDGDWVTIDGTWNSFGIGNVVQRTIEKWLDPSKLE